MSPSFASPPAASSAGFGASTTIGAGAATSTSFGLAAAAAAAAAAASSSAFLSLCFSSSAALSCLSICSLLCSTRSISSICLPFWISSRSLSSRVSNSSNLAILPSSFITCFSITLITSFWISCSSRSARSLALTAAAANPVATAALTVAAEGGLVRASSAVPSPSGLAGPPLALSSTSIMTSAPAPAAASLLSARAGSDSQRTSRAFFAAAAATLGPTMVARKATWAITGLPVSANGLISPPSWPSPGFSPSSWSKKGSSIGRERKKVMHWSWDFVPTCSATFCQFSPWVSRPSKSNKVSSLVHALGSAPSAAGLASILTKSVSVIPAGQGFWPFFISSNDSGLRS